MKKFITFFIIIFLLTFASVGILAEDNQASESDLTYYVTNEDTPHPQPDPY